MPEYPSGTPCWVDLISPDLDASAAFYGGLFGWNAVELGDAEETGGYRQFLLDGRKVAGLTPAWGESQAPAWMTYIAVDDADATAGRIAPAGGTILIEPFDVLDAGRLAVFADAVGAVAGIWQPRAHRGAEVVNRPGSLCWNELQTPRRDDAIAFYERVLGWETVDVSGGGVEYFQWRAAGRPVAALLPVGDDQPTRWVVCFAVDDTDAVAARVEPAGGRLVTPPTDCPIGRYAEFHDPHGAFFQVHRFNDEARAAAEQSAAEIGA